MKQHLKQRAQKHFFYSFIGGFASLIVTLFAVSDNNENMSLAAIGAVGVIISLALIAITVFEICGVKKQFLE